jgi:NAD(P)-dependent dehydrogenase (short-subunit alcohol dehydrogenase family)
MTMPEGPAQFSLAGKVALISGASRGIGAAIAQTYAAAGAAVVLSSRKQEGVDAVAAAVRAAGGEALAVAAHSGDAAAVAALVARAVDTYGGIDILVNNAATNPHFGPLLEAEESQWDKTFDVNVKGYLRLARACVPVLRARGGGKIVNIASVAGLHPQPGMGVYCISKAAVLMLTQVLAAELAPDHIQVNAIAPGYIKTRFSQALWDTPALSAALVAQLPQRRIAAPEELTGIALYLASPAASFTTGAVFVVDGGQLVGGIG